MYENFISYSIINQDNKLIICDINLNITHPEGFEPAILNVILSKFNDNLFLITMTYYNFYKLIGWIGHYNESTGLVDVSNKNYLEIVNNNNVFDFENYGNAISLNITQNCCFIIPYFTNNNVTTNTLYMTIIDMNGNKVLNNNDKYITVLNNSNICGTIQLTMINDDNNNYNKKYFPIYTITNDQIIGYIFTIAI